ncbi:hypothetical protein H4S06_006798, partial [Coemansia sp. BCRC 34490]
MVAAAKRIQRWYRSHLFSRRIDLLRRRCAVEVIERGWIEYCEAKRQREYNASSRVIQALVRGSVARVRFKRMREAKLHADAVRIKEEAEALRREADAERMRAEKARKDAENERARASAQAARAKAHAMAQNLKQLEQEQQRQLHSQQQQQRQLQNPSDSADRHNNGTGHANGIREPPAQYTAQSDDNDSLRTGIVPPALRTDSNAVNEAFARLTMNTSPTSPTGPNAPISYPDIRRISTYSNEAARQHAAEARASLLAAGVAERNAEAELARSNSSNNYSAYSPTVFSSSPRNTYGY